MSDERAALPLSLLKYSRDHVYPAMQEFNAAAEGGAAAEEAARKYISALKAYRERIDDFPGSPGSSAAGPTADDAAAQRAMAGELRFISEEISRVVGHFGGYLPPA